MTTLDTFFNNFARNFNEDLVDKPYFYDLINQREKLIQNMQSIHNTLFSYYDRIVFSDTRTYQLPTELPLAQVGRFYDDFDIGAPITRELIVLDRFKFTSVRSFDFWLYDVFDDPNNNLIINNISVVRNKTFSNNQIDHRIELVARPTTIKIKNNIRRI